MKYNSILNTDLTSSCLAFGGDYFGTLLDETAAFALMDQYVQTGGNHIDTARLYTGGQSEQIIGRWIKDRKPQNMIITTKGAHPRLDTMHISRLGFDQLQSDVDSSLAALGIEQIDLYFLHRDDENIPVGEIMERLNILIKQGKLRYIGASNWKAERIMQANAYCAEKGLVSFCASQIKFSLATTNPDYQDDPTLVEMDAASMAMYQKMELAVMAYASQAKGFFKKMDTLGETGLDEKATQRYLYSENVEKYRRAKTLADKYDVSISGIVLAYLTGMPFVTIPVVGCKTGEQLADSMSGGDLHLSPDEMAFLAGQDA